MFVHGEFSELSAAQKHTIAVLYHYLRFILVLIFKLCRYFPYEESQFKAQSSTVSFISLWTVQGLAVSHHPGILLCNSGSSKQLLYFVLQST